jgi:hypothetical protein
MNVFSSRFLCLLWLVFSAGKIHAQDSTQHKGFGVEANFLAGRIVRHSASFTAPVPRVSVALDVNFIWQSCGKREWNQRRNFPVTGIGFIFTDYRSKNIFGRCIGAYPNLQVPIARNKDVEWTCRLGIGLAYVTKKYGLYPDYDTLNTAVSTNLNAFPVFMTDLRYHVNTHWDIQGGANFTHISNALYREPNLGVNMVGAHLGARYFLYSSKPCKIIRDLPPLSNRWLVDVRGAISHKQARAAGNPVKAAYIGAVSVSRRWRGTNKVFAGVDAAYHKDVYAFLINYGVDYGVEKQNSWDGGVFIGNEFMVGRVGILGIVGVYYNQTFLDFDPIYEKLGVKYYILNKERGFAKELYLSAMLNTHGVVAEYAEFGVGVAF